MTVHAYDTHFWDVTRHLHATGVDDYGQDLCPAYLVGLNTQVNKYVTRNYPNFHHQMGTTYDTQRVARKVIFDHAYKGEQGSISFGLNLKHHMPGADVSTFSTNVVVPGAVTNPKTASHPSRAEKTHEKYFLGRSKENLKGGDCFSCSSNTHLAMYCNNKPEPEVANKIDVAVAKIRENNKLRSQKRDRAK